MDSIKIDSVNPEPSIIQKTADVLKNGGIIIYPTDTAYGLGANALSEEAVRKVYEIKGRDFSKPTHVIVKDWEMIESLCETSTQGGELAKKLYNKFLPGPLTIILPKKEIVPDILTANLSTLGIRIPNNEIAQSLSSLVSFPYTTPSANPSGGETPYNVQEALAQFTPQQQSLIDLVLDVGPLPQTPTSTMIDCASFPPRIIREGPVKKKDIEKVIGMRVE